MKIEVLGTRAKVKPSAPGYENHTGFLIDDTILIDAGEAAFLKRNPKAIVFTHFHPDHAFFVLLKEELMTAVPHFGPEEQELAPRLNVVSGPFEIEGYRFTPVPVIHALKLKSFGYLVEKDDKKVFFSGDVAWIEKAHLKTLHYVDLVITEATFLNKGGRIIRKGDRIFGHTGVPDLVRMFAHYTNKMVFSHFGNWFYEQIEEGPKKIERLQQPGLEIVPAHDGLKIKV